MEADKFNSDPFWGVGLPTLIVIVEFLIYGFGVYGFDQNLVFYNDFNHNYKT